MSDTDLFFSTNPAEPWSIYPIGLPALALVALLLVALTLWSYLGHPQASRRRVLTVLALRLLALLVVLLTAVRPSVGIQEDPKIPSVLLVGVDLSESMTVPDELNQPRIDAVRKTLERCEGLFNELRTEQNVNVVMYGFGPTDFNEATNKYDPATPAKYNRSDYGAYLRKTYDRWQGERFLRGHVVIGDGADNGDAKPEPEAVRWRQAGRAIHTFAVGLETTRSDAKDVGITSVAVTSGNPDGSVFIKTDFTLKLQVNAFGFQGVRVPVRVLFDEGEGYKEIHVEPAVVLERERDNEVELKLKAPDKPGEIKVKVEIPADRVPGDVAPSNNAIETYLTVSKEGMRVLVVNRLSFEHAALRRALQADPRIDLYQVIRQTDEPPSAREREDFDFGQRAYDVIILGNVTAKQLQAIDPQLPAKIAEQVTKRGVGLLMTGGHATFLGTPGLPDATGWRGTPEIENILPVDLNSAPPVPDAVYDDPAARFQFLPTAEKADHYLTRLADTPKESAAQWAKLNDPANHSRFTGLSKVGAAKPTASVFAVASAAHASEPVPFPGDTRAAAPLLVGHQIGVGNRGRVLVMAAQDTYMWQKLGQPKANDGIQLHARFWRHLVRWLAHQEDDEGAAFARPVLKRLPVGGKQTIRVGLRGPGGAPAQDPKFEVRVIAPGQNEAAAQAKTPVPDPDGGFSVPYDPAAPGEYTVKLSATGHDKDGKPVKGEASARFLAYPEATDEMLVKAANHAELRAIATAGGGQFHRLEDLPAFLRELKEKKIDMAKPKPRFLPDWRRDHSHGFLPGWLALFAVLLGGEWGLRRLWGMV
jgi:hypothetical protein